MSIETDMLKASFEMQLKLCGVSMVSDAGESAVLMREDIPTIPDPAELARAKTPVYVRLHGLSGCVSNPRTVKRFTENDRFYRVIKYDDTVSDDVTWKWLAEAQRI